MRLKIKLEKCNFSKSYKPAFKNNMQTSLISNKSCYISLGNIQILLYTNRDQLKRSQLTSKTEPKITVEDVITKATQVGELFQMFL